MKFNNSVENYPSPIIAANDEGFIIAKNYLASMTFPNIHIGARLSNYTDINPFIEKLSSGIFYGKNHTYYASHSNINGEKAYLIVISIASFGEDLFPFNPIEIYRNKVKGLTLDENNFDELKNEKRKYVRNVHNNLIRANYFDTFKGLFETKYSKSVNDSTELLKVCSALEYIIQELLDTIDISFDINFIDTNLKANISENYIISLLLNSLFFSVINSSGAIKIALNHIDDVAEINFNFISDFDFSALYNVGEFDEATENLNSALSLCIALELAKRSNIEYSIEKTAIDGKTEYTIKHKINITENNSIEFASGDTITPLLKKYLLTIFYNQVI